MDKIPESGESSHQEQSEDGKSEEESDAREDVDMHDSESEEQE